MLATSRQRWLVMPISSTTAQAESSTHSAIRAGVGSASPPVSAVSARRGRGARARRERRARDHRGARGEERAGPEPAGRRQRQPRLERERIREQRDQRAEVRDRVERVGRARRVAAREPDRDERPRGREREERQRDVREQHREDLRARIFGALGLPGVAGQHRQRERRRGDGRGMDDELRSRARARDQQIGVRVAREQRGLVERETQRPDRGNAAEPRQDALRDDRLDEEDQERRRERRRGEQQHARRYREPVRRAVCGDLSRRGFRRCGRKR